MRTLVITTLALTLAVPLAASAKDYFGAIAFSKSTKDASWALDYDTKSDAERAASGHCEAMHNAGDCEAINSFVNTCASLATGDEGFGADWDNDKNAAETKAMEACSKQSGNCKVLVSVCSKGE
jgi:serine/threonine-protein kinase